MIAFTTDYDKYYQLNNDIGYIYKTIDREGRVIVLKSG